VSAENGCGIQRSKGTLGTNAPVLSRSFVKIENKKAEHTPVCEHFLFLIFTEIRPKMDVSILWLNIVTY
jgi:hypothetical protein